MAISPRLATKIRLTLKAQAPGRKIFQRKPKAALPLGGFAFEPDLNFTRSGRFLKLPQIAADKTAMSYCSRESLMISSPRFRVMRRPGFSVRAAT